MPHTIFQTVVLAQLLGVISCILARRLGVPAILFYLVSGFAAGPMGANLIDPKSFGDGLIVVVEIGVAIILFEGGLSLSSHSFGRESSGIRRMLIFTISLTGLGATLLAGYFLEMPWQFALFFGTLIVVTGPTVMGSILNSVNLTRRLEILLNWESLWGDVIGVLLSALALEMINLTALSPLASAGHLASLLAMRVLDGVVIGVLSGFLLARIVLPRIIAMQDPVLPGLIVVSGALGTFFLANMILESSGPLAAAISGFFMSHLEGEALHDVRLFKEQLSSLFISTLFVLLSAYVDPAPYIHLWPQMLAVAVILGAAVRPLAVWLALAGTRVSWRERIYAGFVGPRGIIAVATAAYAGFITPGHEETFGLVLNLTIVIIFFSGTIATIICRPLAAMLKVRIPISSSGILIVGINPLTSAIARLVESHVPVAFLDTSSNSCTTASALGHKTLCADYLNGEVYEDVKGEGFARLLVATRNDALNELIARKAAIHLEPEHVYRIPARSPNDGLVMEPVFHNNLAFSQKLISTIAIRQLEEKRARIDRIRGDQVAALGAIPLFQVCNKRHGLRVMTPGAEPEADDELICFISDDGGHYGERPGDESRTVGRAGELSGDG